MVRHFVLGLRALDPNCVDCYRAISFDRLAIEFVNLKYKYNAMKYEMRHMKRNFSTD